MKLERFDEAIYFCTRSLLKRENVGIAGRREEVDEISAFLTQLQNEAREEKYKRGGSVATDARRISIKEFKFIKELGTGNFTSVHYVEHQATQEKFALKVSLFPFDEIILKIR